VLRVLRSLRWVIYLALTWLFIASLLTLYLWPALPRSGTEWLLFLAFGPPLYILGEGVMAWFWSSRLGLAIWNHPSSVVPIFFGVVIGGVVVAFVWWASWSFTK
jgi:hypothetical protein